MKIKALSRSTASISAPGSDVSRLPRNLDPAAHPFAQAREYTRALNATKMERMFAAPFIGQLGYGHEDGVYSLCGDPKSLERLASGAGDGTVKVWDTGSREEVFKASAHSNIVKGLTWTHDRRLLTAAADKTIKLFDPYNAQNTRSAPTATWLGQGAFTSLSMHRTSSTFAASSSVISLYDLNRPSSSKPTQTLHWPTSVDTITTCCFNQTETSILASAGNDRSLMFYDLRTSSPLHKTILTLSANSLAWNPMEAFNIAVASEDHNIYLFDMRNLSRALNVYRDHVAAVMSVAWSPTGQELISGSYDRSIRLWDRSKGHSRDIYHTKRMQRVFSVLWSPDNSYVYSGSDDGNVRVWRAKASARQGVKSARERQKLEYDEKLKERFGHMPEIKRIARHRHLPQQVKKAGEIKTEELKAIKRREENERRHSKKGKTRRRAEREKMVLNTEE